MPVWGVWLEKFYFSTAARSRKARNLVLNAACVIHTEPADEVVVLEGIAEKVTDPALVGQFGEAYRGKYEEDVNTDQFPVYAVRPRVAFAFISDPDQWAKSATRWRFQGD